MYQNSYIEGIIKNMPSKHRSVVKELLTTIHEKLPVEDNYLFDSKSRFVINAINENANMVIPLNIELDYKLERLSVYLEIPPVCRISDIDKAYPVKILTSLINSNYKNVSMFQPGWFKNERSDLLWGGKIGFNNNSKVLIDGILSFIDIAKHSTLLAWIIAALMDEDKLFIIDEHYDYGGGDIAKCDEAFLKKTEELNKEKSRLIEYLSDSGALEKARKDEERWQLSNDYDRDAYIGYDDDDGRGDYDNYDGYDDY